MALRAKRHFRDYEVQETVTRRGRRRLDYVYQGDWYRRKVSRRRRTAERYACLAGSIAAALLLVLAMLRRIEPNISDKIVESASLLCLVAAFCVLVGSAEAFFRKGDLTREAYRERLLMLRVLSLAAAALSLILTARYTAFAFTSAEARGAAMPACVFSFIDTLIYAAIGINEILVKYDVIKAPPRPLKDGEKQSDEPKQYYD